MMVNLQQSNQRQTVLLATRRGKKPDESSSKNRCIGFHIMKVSLPSFHLCFSQSPTTEDCYISIELMYRILIIGCNSTPRKRGERK